MTAFPPINLVKRYADLASMFLGLYWIALLNRSKEISGS